MQLCPIFPAPSHGAGSIKKPSSLHELLLLKLPELFKKLFPFFLPMSADEELPLFRSGRFRRGNKPTSIRCIFPLLQIHRLLLSRLFPSAFPKRRANTSPIRKTRLTRNQRHFIFTDGEDARARFRFVPKPSVHDPRQHDRRIPFPDQTQFWNFIA